MAPLRIGWAPAGAMHPVAAPAMPWYVDALGMSEVWPVARGHGVRVAVLDTGVASVDGLPPDRVLHFQPDGTPLAWPPGIGSDHGTACASLVASGSPSTQGMAPEATVLSFRIDGASGRPLASKVLAVLRDGAGRAGADVVSCSFVMDELSDDLERAVRDAVNAGILVVGAAGNEANVASAFPEKSPQVLATAALDRSGNPLAGGRFGPWVDVAAPGEELSVMTSSGGPTSWLGKTSGAAALVSGIAATMLSVVSPDRRRRLAKALPGLITSTAADVGPPGPDPYTGAGAIAPRRLLAAVRSLEPHLI